MLVIAAALTSPACRLADFDAHRADYERLVMLRLQDPDATLWFTSTAPPEARQLMLRLGLDAVLSDWDAGWVQLREGGGYTRESGYFYLRPRADTAALYLQHPRLRRLAPGWYAY